MKINKVGPPAGGPKQVDSASPKKVAKDFSEVLKGTQANAATATQAPNATARTNGVLPPDQIHEIATQLRTGAVSKADLPALIVNKVLESKGISLASGNLKEKLQKRLTELVQSDPTLQASLDRILHLAHVE
ncbi:MAG: hypothetical protein J7M25_14180 [Deltaproteobacteria bacterium]|nr:hypothetical protein [Deltaproteobacteria bacterium]